MLKYHTDIIFDSLDDLTVINIFDKTLLAYDRRMSILEDKISGVIAENHVLQISLENCRLVMQKKNQEYDEKITALTGRIDVASKLSKRGGEVSFFSPELNRRIALREGKVVDKEKEALQKKIDEQNIEIQRLKNEIKDYEDENIVLQAELTILSQENKSLNKNSDEHLEKFIYSSKIYDTLSQNLRDELYKESISETDISPLIDSINPKPEGKSWKECYEESNLMNINLLIQIKELKKNLEKATILLCNQNLHFYQAINGFIYDSKDKKESENV